MRLPDGLRRRHGARCPGYRFANWETGYGDLHAVIDPQTVRPLPWLPGSALVLCDLLTLEGEPVEVSPRRILRRQLERAAGHGLEIKCATELEFYLFLDSFAEAADKHWQDLAPHADTIEDYQLLQTSREEYIIGKIRNQMVEAGIPIEFSKGEAGIGQHEINITYGGALEVADRHLVFKNGVKEIASGFGRAATFMAKWSMDTAGSSCHIHTSLWDAESRHAPDGPGGRTRTPLGVLRASVPSSWPVSSSPPTSWPGASPRTSTPTGATCPTPGPRRPVVWGEDNRTCGFRAVGQRCRSAGREPHPGGGRQPVPGAGRGHRRRSVGHRARAGARAGLHRQRLPRTAEVPRIPTTLAEAIDRLADSEVAAEAFGPDVHHHLLNTARQEWAAANRVVTDWELARNFERI